MDDNFSLCGICYTLLKKIDINKNRSFRAPCTQSVIKISDALLYVAPEANVNILEQMVLCCSCLENLRCAYKFKYDCLLAQTRISKHLKENNLTLVSEKEKVLSKKNDVSSLREQLEDISDKQDINTSSNNKSANNGENRENPLEFTESRFCETDAAFKDNCSQWFSLAGENTRTFETKSVQTEPHAKTKIVVQFKSQTVVERFLEKLRTDQNLGIDKKSLEVYIGSENETQRLLEDELTESKKETQMQQLKVQTLYEMKDKLSQYLNTKKITVQASVNPTAIDSDDGASHMEEILDTEIEPSESTFDVPKLLMDKDGPKDVPVTTDSSENNQDVQEASKEVPELTFCETTGAFKNNQDQYVDTDGQFIDSAKLEEAAQKALEKANSTFKEPLQSNGLAANAGLLTPVTVKENNGMLSIIPIGDAIENSFLTLDNRFMTDDMIDIKEEPLDYDFDTNSTGDTEDTVSAPETALLESREIDEYIDIPEFVMINKDGENAEANLKKMQPEALKEKLLGREHRKIQFEIVKNARRVVPVENVSPGHSEVKQNTRLTGESKIRTYKKIKMVPAFEKPLSPSRRVWVDPNFYPVRRQDPMTYEKKYLASFFTTNGDYIYDHDYIINMYHQSSARVLDVVQDMKLWFCRLCNNQQWTRNHGRHMLEEHATQTFCTLCHVDMRTPFALNVHMEEHTNACGSEKVTYGARAAHARKHRALAQDICDSVVTEHAQKKRTRQQDTDEIPASASGIRSSSDDRAAERVSAEAKVQKHMYMSDDDSQDAPDDVNRDASYQPGRDQKQAIQKKKRQKVEAVKPSGRLLRSQSKKSREIGRVFS